MRIRALTPLAVLLLFSCSNKPAEQSQTPPASTPPAAAEQVAQAAPPAAQPPASTPSVTSENAATQRPAAPPIEKHAPKPASKPVTPPPPPRPQPVAKTVPAGTVLNAELVDPASSATSQIGDPVRARVTEAVVIDGLTVVPQGAVVSGTVTEAVSLKKIGGQASLGLKFESIDVGGGQSAPIVAMLKELGKSETGKDAGTIAGATAGGALLGRALSHHDKTKGTLIGAVVGAAAGTGIAAATKGKEVELPAGTPFALHLEQPVTVTVRL